MNDMMKKKKEEKQILIDTGHFRNCLEYLNNWNFDLTFLRLYSEFQVNIHICKLKFDMI